MIEDVVIDMTIDTGSAVTATPCHQSNAGRLLFLPGDRLEIENLRKNKTVLEQGKIYAKEKTIDVICVDSSIMALLGILMGKQATCCSYYEGKMKDAFLTGDKVTIDGNVIIEQGLGIAFPFVFELVKILVVEDKINQVKAAICYGYYRPRALDDEKNNIAIQRVNRAEN